MRLERLCVFRPLVLVDIFQYFSLNSWRHEDASEVLSHASEFQEAYIANDVLMFSVSCARANSSGCELCEFHV